VASGKNGSYEQHTIMEERKRWLLFGLPFTFTKYTLTNKKLVINEGLFVTHENEILLYRILDMSYSRSLIQKMFGMGSIKVDSQDVSSPVFTMKNIKHSKELKEALSEAVENEKLRLSIRRGEVIGVHDSQSDFDDDINTDSFNDGF